MANKDESSFYVEWLPYSILLGLCGIVHVISVVVIAITNYRIFVFQWRYLVYSTHFLIINIPLQIQIYYISPNWDPAASIREYAQCVGSKPRDTEHGCSKEDLTNFWFLWLSRLLLYTGPILVTAYVYWTSGHIQRWWIHFLRTRSLPDAASVQSGNSVVSSKSASTSRSKKSGESMGGMRVERW